MCNTDRLVKKLSMNNLIASDRCYTFHHVCEYKEVYRHDKSNDYSKLNDNINLKKKGIYFFSLKDEILYIGCSCSKNEEWGIINRVKQHFIDKDSGSLRCKLNDKEKKMLEESSLYYMNISGDKREVLFLESLLIGSIKPRFNFLEKLKNN